MNKMSHRERIWAAVRGGDVDRLPISLWRHFGGMDMTAEGLSDAMVGFQEEYDWDFVKFMPTGTYSIMDWGGETHWSPNLSGVRDILELPIQTAADWGRLEPLDTHSGMFGMVNDALAKTVERIGADTPVLQTVFSPLSTARKLGGPSTLAYLRNDPAALEAGLKVIEDVTRHLMIDAVDRGADIFYVFQSGTADVLTGDEFERFELGYARRLLSELPEDTLALLHSHGDHLWFGDLLDLPVDGINWHDQTGGPSLSEARKLTDKALCGGFDGWSMFRNGSVASVVHAVEELRWGAGSGIIASPGCIVPTDSSPHLMRAARDAVDHSTLKSVV